jgi:hypothetical protein
MLTYCMTPAQSDDWTLGGAAAAQVEQAIADQIAVLDVHEDVVVILDDSSIAFTLTQGRA